MCRFLWERGNEGVMVVFRASQWRGARAPRDKHSAWAHERCGGAGVVGWVRSKVRNGRAHGSMSSRVHG
jgi:hypothetical protein